MREERKHLSGLGVWDGERGGGARGDIEYLIVRLGLGAARCQLEGNVFVVIPFSLSTPLLVLYMLFVGDIFTQLHEYVFLPLVSSMPLCRGVIIDILCPSMFSCVKHVFQGDHVIPCLLCMTWNQK